MGDVSGFSVPLARGPGSGIGVVLRGTPLTTPDNFDETFVEGEAPIGWDAELYVGGRLFDFQRIGSSGRYRFSEIPLDFGSNAIVVKLYGPSGEEETVDHSQRVGSRLQPGEVQWQAHIGKPDRQLFQIGERRREPPDAWVGSMRATVGITRELDIGVSFARVAALAANSGVLRAGSVTQTSDGLIGDTAATPTSSTTPTHTSDFYGVSFTQQILGRPVNVNYALQDTGKSAFSLRSSMPVGPLSFGLAYEQNDRDFGVIGGNGSARMQNKYAVRTSIPLKWIGLNSSLSISHEETRNFDNSRVAAQQLGLGHRFYKVQLGHSINRLVRYSNSGGGMAQTDYRLLTSYNYNLWTLRGQANFALQPNSEFRNASISTSRRLSDEQFVSGSVSFSGAGNYSYSLGYAHLFDRFNISASAGYGAGNWSVGLGINTSFGHVPGYGGRMEPRLNLERGMALITATEQLGDGIPEPVMGLQMHVNQRQNQRMSNGNGKLILDELETLYPVRLSVARGSLPDPFLVPLLGDVEIWPRPGQSIQIPIDLVESTQLSGYAWIALANGGRIPLRRMHVQLLDERGFIRAETLTLDDGFYEFESAFPGRWLVRMKPEQPQLRAPIDTNGLPVDIAEGEIQVNDVNLIFAQPAPAQEPVEESEVLQPEAQEPAIQLETIAALNVLFAFDADEVTEEYQQALAEMVGYLQSISGTLLLVHGHTDLSGPNDYNIALSERRARAVKRVLVERYDVPEQRIVMRYSGKDKPLIAQRSEPLDALNRRVEVRIVAAEL